MTLRQLYEALEQRIPSALSCPWDNDGAMLCLDWEKEVLKVMTCLDVTEGCVRAAMDQGVDLIVSHHPMIFRPLKRMDASQSAFRLPALLLKAGISVFSFHTRLDAVSGGLNDRLAELLGMEQVRQAEGEEGNLVRVGTVRQCSPSAFAQRVANRLGCEVSCMEGERPIRTVMSVCGGGKDFLPLALEMGADAFVSGDLSYNACLDANALGLTVLDAGHRATELPVCSLLKEMLLAISPKLLVVEHPFGGEKRLFNPQDLDK